MDDKNFQDKEFKNLITENLPPLPALQHSEREKLWNLVQLENSRELSAWSWDFFRWSLIPVTVGLLLVSFFQFSKMKERTERDEVYAAMTEGDLGSDAPDENWEYSELLDSVD